VGDILAEIRQAQDTYRIKDFAFYADLLPWDTGRNLEPLLEALIADQPIFASVASCAIIACRDLA